MTALDVVALAVIVVPSTRRSCCSLDRDSARGARPADIDETPHPESCRIRTRSDCARESGRESHRARPTRWSSPPTRSSSWTATSLASRATRATPRSCWRRLRRARARRADGRRRRRVRPRCRVSNGRGRDFRSPRTTRSAATSRRASRWTRPGRLRHPGFRRDESLRRVDGDYFAVMGLSLVRLVALMRDHISGLRLFRGSAGSRSPASPRRRVIPSLNIAAMNFFDSPGLWNASMMRWLKLGATCGTHLTSPSARSPGGASNRHVERARIGRDYQCRCVDYRDELSQSASEYRVGL